jgi:streptogramin lyase
MSVGNACRIIVSGVTAMRRGSARRMPSPPGTGDGGMGIAHIRNFARRAACFVALAAGLAATATAAADVPDGIDCQDTAFFTAGVVCRAEPFSPETGGLELDQLDGSGSPEDDLLQALTDLSTAPDAIAAARFRGRALAILDGDPTQLAGDDREFLTDKAYNGIPLLNTTPKVQEDLSAGATVDVREVRFGDHALLDTSALRFRPDAMNQPFTIRWQVTELGTSFGGELSPAWIPRAAGAGELTMAEPLVVRPLGTGTTAINRFHPVGAGEETRLVTQVVEVQMPAPASIGAILDPNLKPGHETFAQIAVGSTADPAPELPAASEVAPGIPERVIRDDLAALEPDPETLAALRGRGAADAALVADMRSRDTLPAGDRVVAAADINVQLANAEAYVSRRELRLAPDTKPDGTVQIAVTNLDTADEPRTFTVRELRNRTKELGVLDWGAFQTDVIGSVSVGPNQTKTVTVKPDPSAYSLWLGDPAGGDQAGMAVALDRGARQQSLELGEGGILPLHQVLDREGNIWVTIEGNDEVMRLKPNADRPHAGPAAPERFLLPGGIAAVPPADGVPAEPVLGPADIAIDGHGILWVTLTAGNAVARIDPEAAADGTTNGIKIFKLAPCDATCRKPPPPLTAAPLSRLPLQMRVHLDGAGNTVVFFTEQNADRIGALRVSAAGEQLNEQHFDCACVQPLGIALDPDGAVWFSEGTSNRLGKLTLGQTRPFADTSSVEHYVIPNPVPEFVPGQPKCTPPAGQLLCADGQLPNPAMTALPHSVAVDRRGRVWYTGEANERVGYLDPAKAKAGTSEGFVDTLGPKNEFGRELAPADIAIDRAGKAYFTDEYGDQIATATVAADGSIDARFAFRPSARNSLTDAPMVDDKGNLWFIEGGANLITRISGVTAGLPLPAEVPSLSANTATGRITASGLHEMTSADVRVLRGGTVVAHADAVPVLGGGFEVTLPLRAEDRVRLVPRGGANPPAPFSFRVANLTAAVGADGDLTGTATNDGEPLADFVTIDAGAGEATARIDIAEGTYALAGSLSAATARGTVSWTAGTTSARFKTITPFGPATGGGSTGGGPKPGAGPGTSPAPAGGGGAPSVPSIPATPPGIGQKPGPTSTSTDAACTTSRWLTRRGSGTRARRTLPLLGLSAADARRCLGRPAKVRRSGATERWTYTGSVELRLAGGKVTGFTLTGRTLRSAPDRAAVGRSVASFRRALGPLVRAGSGYRGLVALGADSFADVRIAAAGGKVRRVTVTVKARGALDATARRMLRSTR